MKPAVRSLMPPLDRSRSGTSRGAGRADAGEPREALPVRAWAGASGHGLALTALLLAGCSTGPVTQAPVETRGTARNVPAVAGSAPASASAPVVAVDALKPLPGAENFGKPGYYAVKPGDTLIRIGLENGQNWKDLVRWNNLENPNVIEVGQVLRVVPPNTDPTLAGTRPVALARVETRPLDAPAAAASGAASGPLAAASVPASAPAPVAAPTAQVQPVPIASPASARDGDENVNWGWPASGNVVSAFDEGRNKGLAIAGRAGDPVFASADGRVVYAGSGLRGYGNLVILKHNNTYLTAYAHNQSLLVKEDQTVKRGQKIAEMGSTDAERVQLHFEIRKQGKPIDPAKLLPSR